MHTTETNCLNEKTEISRFWTPDDFFDQQYRHRHETEIQDLLDKGLFDNHQADLTMDDSTRFNNN